MKHAVEMASRDVRYVASFMIGWGIQVILLPQQSEKTAVLALLMGFMKYAIDMVSGGIIYTY
jgi:hypothetical protein